MGIHSRLRRVGQRAVEDGLLDRLELPAVVLAVDVDAQPIAVVVLLAPDTSGRHRPP